MELWGSAVFNLVGFPAPMLGMVDYLPDESYTMDTYGARDSIERPLSTELPEFSGNMEQRPGNTVPVWKRHLLVLQNHLSGDERQYACSTERAVHG